jgi:hypothetical protein
MIHIDEIFIHDIDYRIFGVIGISPRHDGAYREVFEQRYVYGGDHPRDKCIEMAPTKLVDIVEELRGLLGKESII